MNADLRGARSQTSAGAAMGSESYSYAIGAATLSFRANASAASSGS